jgi:hypothetical protein
MEFKQIKFILIIITSMGLAFVAMLVWNFNSYFNSPESQSEIKQNDLERQALIKAKGQPACMSVDPKTINQIAAFQADIAHWQTYRNAQYGFEIKYPGVPRYRKWHDISPCGYQLGVFFNTTTAIRTDLNQYNQYGTTDQNAEEGYDITVYSNPQNLAPKDFFLCKMKNAGCSNEIKSIGNVSVGEQKIPGVRIVLDNANEEIMIPSGGDFVDIAWTQGNSTQIQPKEIDQMLSTFKFAPQNDAQGIARVDIPDNSLINGDVNKDNYNIEYIAPAKIVAYANGLAKVEFRQRGPHAGIYSNPEGFFVGTGSKVINADGTEQWEMLLPGLQQLFGPSSICRFDELCALGYDAKGKKVGEYCLYDVFVNQNM